MLLNVIGWLTQKNIKILLNRIFHLKTNLKRYLTTVQLEMQYPY